MNERHARAFARSIVTALIVGLGAIVICSFVPLVGRYVTCAAMVVVDLAVLLYLWIATLPEPEVRQPSTARAIYESRQRRREGRG